MSTILSANTGNLNRAAHGLSNEQIAKFKSSGSDFQTQKDKIIGDNVKNVFGQTTASTFLTTLQGKIQNRSGILKLMHTEHSSKTLSFETKSFISLRLTQNQRKSETEAALMGLFRALRLNPDQLDQLRSEFPRSGQLQAKHVAKIISNALIFEKNNKPSQIHLPEAQVAAPKPPPGNLPKAVGPTGDSEQRLATNLKSFRKISVGGIEIGGSARPLNAGLKEGVSSSDVLKDIQNAGFSHILSLDQSKQYGHEQLKSEIQNHAPQLEHLNPENLNIRDMFEKGDTDAYADSVPLSTAAFKEFQTLVQDLARENKKVLVHCGAGSGRTGTMMASLILADLVKSDPSKATKGSEFVSVIDEDGEGEISTTSRVAKAISIVRSADQLYTGGPQKAYSVESEAEVRLLEQYEKELLKNPVP